MASGKAICVALLLAFAAVAVFSQEASAQQPTPKTSTVASKCGITGCKRCNKRGNGLCTRCGKGYVLNNGGTCDCAPGYGVCTNPATMTGGRRHTSPKVCPNNGLAPKKLYCQKCKKNGGGGGSLVWGPGVAICGVAPVVTNTVNVRIVTSAPPAVDASQAVKGCDPAVLTAIKDAFVQFLTNANATNIVVTPNPITCGPAAPGGGTQYDFTITWTGGPSQAQALALLNATPNPQTQCALTTVDWCAAYKVATGGDVLSVSGTSPVNPSPLPSPGNTPPAPVAFN